MLVRSVDPATVEAFAGLSTPPLNCLAAVEGDEVIASVGLDLCDNVLAPDDGELALADLRWAPGRADAADAVVRAALDAAPPDRPVTVRTILGFHADVADRLAVLGTFGFVLYQEKHGYWWSDDGQPLPVPAHLTVRRLADVGPDAFARVVAECHTGSLDRHDLFRAARLGADHEARLMLTFYDEVADRDSWLYAEIDGEPVGFVAVGDFGEEGVGTIVYIGVRPEHRGRGHVDELLRAANLAARARGMRAVLSDVDVLNIPMAAALRRAGHQPWGRPWHVWHHRRLPVSRDVDLPVPHAGAPNAGVR